MNFLLIAVLTSSTIGSFGKSYRDGGTVQTSVTQSLNSLDQCTTAAKQLIETYSAGNFQSGAPARGQIRCVNLDTKEVTIVYTSPQ